MKAWFQDPETKELREVTAPRNQFCWRTSKGASLFYGLYRFIRPEGRPLSHEGKSTTFQEYWIWGTSEASARRTWKEVLKR